MTTERVAGLETLERTGPVAIDFDTSAPFPDLYADSVQVGVGPFGVQFTFALTDPQQESVRRAIGRIRVSPQLAGVMTRILRKTIRQAKAEGINFEVPPEVLKKLNLADEEM